jgi:hypothetical protein
MVGWEVPSGYIASGEFLFLQEQIKDIIIINCRKALPTHGTHLDEIMLMHLLGKAVADAIAEPIRRAPPSSCERELKDGDMGVRGGECAGACRSTPSRCRLTGVDVCGSLLLELPGALGPPNCCRLRDAVLDATRLPKFREIVERVLAAASRTRTQMCASCEQK